MTPDWQDISYGPHERHRLDVYRPRTARSKGLVVWFHGGGFTIGDKRGGAPYNDLFLEAGLTVASADYRLRQDAPYPAPMLDGARATQFLRYRAAKFGIDPRKIGAVGGSAGGQIALWVAFHKDLADPASDDPVLNCSSRLVAVAADGAQTVFDPRVLKELIQFVPEDQYEYWGVQPDQTETDRARRIFEDCSAATHATADSPPVFLTYQRECDPITSEMDPGRKIHHAVFGQYLKRRLDALGVECTWTYKGDGQGAVREEYWKMIVAFFLRHFAAQDARPACRGD